MRKSDELMLLVGDLSQLLCFLLQKVSEAQKNGGAGFFSPQCQASARDRQLPMEDTGV